MEFIIEHGRLFALLITGAIIAALALRVIKRRQQAERYQPSLGDLDSGSMPPADDGIIAVRKISSTNPAAPKPMQRPQTSRYAGASTEAAAPVSRTAAPASKRAAPSASLEPHSEPVAQAAPPAIVVMHVAAKEQPFMGYELLQALLASGMRFGHMNIFHYHENNQADGRVLFSLASATEPGTFDMQHMGAFSCTGLTLFLQLQAGRDNYHAFDLLYKTAAQLADDLSGDLLDAKRVLISGPALAAYHQHIKHFEDAHQFVSA